MNLISLLSEILGNYKEHGKGEHYFPCPFCHHRTHKFAVNVNKNVFHCWHCGAKGRSLITLFKRLDVSPYQMQRLRECLTDEQLQAHTTSGDDTPELHLPREFIPLWEPSRSFAYLRAVKYLKERGITGTDVLRYQMGYAIDGPYANRIIIPSYDETNSLNYFVARAFYGDKMKYRNPPVSKNVVVFENQINWDVPVVLCEGVFDAIAIRRNAIPLLGKFIPSTLKKKLISNKVSSVYIALDSDATLDALELERTLSPYGIDVKMVMFDKKDPSELGFHKTWEAIYNGRSTSFKEYIETKLG